MKKGRIKKIQIFKNNNLHTVECPFLDPNKEVKIEYQRNIIKNLFDCDRVYFTFETKK